MSFKTIEEILNRIADTAIGWFTLLAKGPIAPFLSTPLTALFSPKIYRAAIQATWHTGVLRTAYGALIVTVLLQAVFLQRASISDDFFRWITQNTPSIIWTPQGLSLENGQKTAALIHPQYGPIAVFDMTRTKVANESMGAFSLYVTSKEIAFQKMPGNLDRRDVTKTIPSLSSPLPGQLRITGKTIEKFYHTLKTTFLLGAPLVFFSCFFFLLLAIHLTYGAAGLLLNLLRKQRLSYREVFNLACVSTGILLATTCCVLIASAFLITLPSFLIPASFVLSLFYHTTAVILIRKPASQPS